MKKLILLILLVCIGCMQNKEVINMRLTSVFEHNSKIPEKYTCDGQNINPPLKIEGISKGTKTLALIIDDPDAPAGTFVHWLVWDIKPNSTLKENSSPGVQGKNGFNKNSYSGPCPPSGTHRYFFKIYALDTELILNEDSRKPDLEKAMKGHILAKAELIGLYSRA